MTVAASQRAGAEGGTKRFRAKRDAILAAAAVAINEQGARGMTLADVAQRVGLNTTSVTYYFRRKEDLAAAAFEHSIEGLHAALDVAAREADPRARVTNFVAQQFDRLAAARRGEATPHAILSDLRALDDPAKSRLLGLWTEVFRKARLLWGPPADAEHKQLNGARAHVLMENMFWLTAWLDRYDLDEYPRIERRLVTVLSDGLALPGAAWAPTLLALGHEEGEAGRGAFLTAATSLINQLGYRGASVQKIASELNVTKGSFYHHLDAKDELVAECYKRSFDLIAGAQAQAHGGGRDAWAMLADVLATLIDVQFAQNAPLLRTTALSGLPPRVRRMMIDRSNRIARRFAGMISDGIAEGSLRPVDPLVASQSLMAAVNAAFDLRKWAATMPRARAVAMYASTQAFGLFDDRAAR